MNDQELLELAASASGLQIIGGFGMGDRPGCDVLDESRDSGARWWSPLSDDGDALRLALKLRISICHFQYDMVASHGIKHWAEPRGGDDAAAARRAITRAAAEIGKQLKEKGDGPSS